MANQVKTRTKAKVASPCIWMQSGVVKKKECKHYYDCSTCKFDAGMVKMAAAGRHITWQEAMRKHESQDRTCRHAMTSRANHRICPMNYNCSRCDFDQMLEETLSPTVHSPAQLSEIKGFSLARDRYFHSGHTWARIENGGLIRVGMDDFSFKVLGSPDRFELPLMGNELNQDNVGWGIRRNENSADILSPVNGVITNVNQNIGKAPESTSADPYARGWLFTVHNSDIKGAVKDLMAEDQTSQWLDNEIHDLEQMIEKVTGPLAADGGMLKSDIYGTLPTLGWNNLVHRFLEN